MRGLNFSLLGALALTAGVAAPVVDPDRTVTITLAAPHAREVRILGDFVADRAGALMESAGNGTWNHQTGPLETGIYFYRFNVDGLNAADPTNPMRRRGVASSVLEVRGQEPLIEDRDESLPRGAVHIETLFSRALGRSVQCYIYTPRDYRSSDRKYPVLYLLHGGSGDPSNWTASGAADVMADNLIGQGRMKPMIIVMPHAEFPRRQPYTDEVRREWLDTFEHHLIDEVMPLAETRYRITGTQEERWLAGLSNGGSQTLHVGFHRPDLFSVIASFSTRLRDGFESDYPALSQAKTFNSAIRLFYFACGEWDRNWTGFNASLESLHRLGIRHERVVSVGGHTWFNWRRYLADLLPRL